MLRIIANTKNKKKSNKKNENSKDNQDICHKFTKQISKEIKKVIKIVNWYKKTSSEKRMNIMIYDILNNSGKKKIIDNIEDLVYKIIDLVKRNLVVTKK